MKVLIAYRSRLPVVPAEAVFTLGLFQDECEVPEAGEEPTHQPSVAILAQAQQGGCPIGPRDTFFSGADMEPFPSNSTQLKNNSKQLGTPQTREGTAWKTRTGTETRIMEHRKG